MDSGKTRALYAYTMELMTSSGWPRSMYRSFLLLHNNDHDILVDQYCIVPSIGVSLT